MEASHEKSFTPIFFTKVCWKPKKKSQEESRAGEVPGEMRPWLVWCQCNAVIDSALCFPGLGPSQASPSAQEKLKYSSPRDRATQNLPSGRWIHPWHRDACAIQGRGCPQPRLAPLWSHCRNQTLPKCFLASTTQLPAPPNCHFFRQPQHPALLLTMTAQERRQISGCSLTPAQPESWKSKWMRSRFIID